MKTRNKIFAILLTVCLIAISFFRNFAFTNLNALMNHKLFNSPVNYADESLSFLFSLTYKEVYVVKWILLAIFSLLFYLVTWMILHFSFSTLRQKVRKFVFLFYLFIGLLIGVVLLFFFIPSVSKQSYMVSRRLLEILHSPIPTMLFFLIFKIQQKLDEKEKLKPE